MEFWPADFRTDIATSTKKRRKGKELHRTNEQGIEPGTLGAATLTSGSRGLEWITLVQPRSRNLPRVVGKPLEIFPSTKPPPVNVPRLTVHQRAEQGARFLRTYHPDVDIPFELIKDELQSDDEETGADSALNPYAGNRLVHLCVDTKRKQRTHFLAFACGETGSDLNVSPFRSTRDKRVLFSPSAAPTVSFDTPIQQVVAFLPNTDINQKFSFLAVRTHSIVSILKLQGGAGYHAEGPPIVSTAVSVSPSETGGRRTVDVSCSMLPSSNAQVLLVNDMGAVFNCRLQGENKTLTVASNAGISEDSKVDHFWRIARKDVNICMRTSGKRVHLFDLRARTALPLELFHVKEAREYMTSIEAPSGGRHTMCFSTTSKLVWLDERNLKSSVLSLNHQRAFDRTLCAETILSSPSSLTTLSSTANHLVTVYDVNHGSSGHIHSYGEPSMLSGSPYMDPPIAGSVFFRHPAEEGSGFGLFQLSSRGSVWKTNIAFPAETVDIPTQGSNSKPDSFEWSEEVRGLVQKAKTMTGNIGNLGGREYFDANLRGIYEKIFQMQRDAPETPEADPEAVYQTLEKMPFFWQDMDGPAEHMLTTFDVAFQSGLEPLHASRADFLTESLLSSPQGFAALPGGRIPIPRLVSTVRWYHDLSSLPARMVPNVSTRSQPLMDQFRGEALAHAATPEGMKRATEATQHLALDLALSRYVYAPQSFSRSAIGASSELDESNLLSQATKAMSLVATEPPPVHFGFLRPVAGAPHNDEEQMESKNESHDVDLNTPLGVRLLISQWEVGTNPEEYVYKDPYEEQDAAPMPRKPAPARRVAPTGGQETQQSTHHISRPTIFSVSRAPPVVASTSRPMATGQGGPPVRTTSMFEIHALPGSSPARHVPSFLPNNEGATANSQEAYPLTFSSQEHFGPSTQPLPGPFGGEGRQVGGAKKKAIKKRMGGF